jgi:hypothetical protein
MCNNWLGNWISASYEALLDRCCDTWNKFIDQLRRIMAIGLPAWVLIDFIWRVKKTIASPTAP